MTLSIGYLEGEAPRITPDREVGSGDGHEFSEQRSGGGDSATGLGG